MDRHVWFYAMIHPLYPLFKDYADISNETDVSAFSCIVNYLEKHNVFFQKFRLDRDKDLSPIMQIAETASRLSMRESDHIHGEKATAFQPLQSVFSTLYDHKNMTGACFPIKSLKLSNILPTTHETGNIEQLFAQFLDELKHIHNKHQLFYLLEKYFWCISSSKAPDISLYDEIKTTAAIAICLYSQYEKGFWDITQADDTSSEQFLLIHGDVSGIQRFIFNIPSKGAAKSLKGRSVYIGMLSDVIVRHLLDELGLYETNLLYNGGGNFFILAPAHQEQKLKELRSNILSHLLKVHDGDVYFAIDAVSVKMNDFSRFTKLWDQVKGKANQLKKRKWSELGLEGFFTDLFGPVDDGSEETEVCQVCGSFGGKHPVHVETLEDEQQSRVCTLCSSFIQLTNELRSARFLVLRKRNKSNTDQNPSSYSTIFNRFGYEVRFSEKEPESFDHHEMWYTLNDTNFLDKGCTGFLFGAYALPKGEENQITFEELSKRAVKEGRGDSKIAHLKLDVDNLGAMFRHGLGERSSISRVSVLSRMMGLYFEGYINQLIKEKEWEQYLYVVFSGGDDTYIVGTWDKVFAFAEAFYKDFRIFTGENPYVTFSAAINIFNYQFPVIRGAELTESSLDSAKAVRPSAKAGIPPIKNKVSFLGEIFNWEEFKQIKAIETILEKMLIQYDNQSVLQKVSRSTAGFKNILKESTKGKFRNIKFWRLAYYLREIKKAESNGAENYVEQLIEQYRKIVIHNLFKDENKEKIHQIMIIPAAIKWAQLATRKVEGEENG